MTDLNKAYPIIEKIKTKGLSAIKNCQGDAEDALYVLWQDRDLICYDWDYVRSIFESMCAGCKVEWPSNLWR